MQKVFYIVILVVSSSAIFTQEDEELEVKGNVLFKDQGNLFESASTNY